MNDIETLMSTIAVVFPPVSQTEMDEDMLTALLKPPINLSQSQDGASLFSSARAQMEVLLFPNKLNVRELSGDQEQAAGKIPNVVHGFLDVLNVNEPASFGINYQIEVSCVSPSEWIGSTFLAKSLSDTFDLDSQVRSNHVAVVFDRAPKVWTIRFIGHKKNRLRIDLNSSEQLEGKELYSREFLSEQLIDQGRQLTELVLKLKG
jgi:hypothetical protein